MSAATTFTRVTVDPALAKRLQRAAAKSEQAREERDRLVIEAIVNGGSYREVAQLIGVSHPTVMKIVLSAEKIEMPPHGRIPPLDE